jgi:hypothetical protein
MLSDHGIRLYFMVFFSSHVMLYLFAFKLDIFNVNVVKILNDTRFLVYDLGLIFLLVY